MANGEYEGHMANRKVRGSFLLLEQTLKKTIRWKKEKEKEGEKEKKKKKIKEKRKKNGKEKKEKKMKKGKKKRKNKRDEENRARRRNEKKKKEKGFDSRCSNCWKSLVRELKLVYSTRATSRCQKQKR